MRQPCFYSALSGRQAAFERHWRAFGGGIGVKIAVFWCFARRNVGVHGQISFSFESFRVVFASNRSFLIAFLFGRRVARGAGGGFLQEARGGFRRSMRRGSPGDSEGLGARVDCCAAIDAGPAGRRASGRGSYGGSWGQLARVGLGTGASGRCPLYQCASQSRDAGSGEGGPRRPALWCQGPGEFGDGMVQGSGAGMLRWSLGLRKSSGCCGVLLIVEGGLGLFSAMALLSTRYKGAGVPLFFYNGVG